MFQVQTFQEPQRNYLATPVTGDAYPRSGARPMSSTLGLIFHGYGREAKDYFATTIRQVDSSTGLFEDVAYSLAGQIRHKIAPLKAQAKLALTKRVNNFYELKDALINEYGISKSEDPYIEFKSARTFETSESCWTYGIEAPSQGFEAYEAYENLLSKLGAATLRDHILISGARAEQRALDQLRPTTEHEHAIAELRQWHDLQANWDGEGADAPRRESLEAASQLICLIMWGFKAPEPMLHANGRAGLLWDDDDLYGEIEFLDENKLAYYFRDQQGKHKGEVIFEGNEIPDALKVLIPEENAV